MEKLLVPELRFGGFSEKWKKVKINELGEVITGATPPTVNKSYYNGEYPWVTPTDISDSKYIAKTSRQLTKDGLNNGRIVPKGSVLVTCIASIGKICILTTEGSCNQQINAIIPSIENNNEFVYYLMDVSAKLFKRFANQTSIMILNKTDFSNLNINTPSLPEQQKIATFLSTLDSRIELQERKVENLEEKKKGIMHKIFSQEIRFKDDEGKEYGEWEEQRLEDISSYQSSNISLNSLNNYTGKELYPIYDANSMCKFVDFYNQGNEYISIIKDGAGVGRLRLCEKESSILGTMGHILNKEDNNLYFLFYLLKTIDFRIYITGTTIPHIYYKDYKKHPINVPSPLEQQKIANFLSILDLKIEKEKKLLEGLREKKKGLLQKMFVG